MTGHPSDTLDLSKVEKYTLSFTQRISSVITSLKIDVAKNNLWRPGWLSRHIAPISAILAGRDGPRWKTLSDASLATVSSNSAITLATSHVEQVRAWTLKEDVECLLIAVFA